MDFIRGLLESVAPDRPETSISTGDKVSDGKVGVFWDIDNSRFRTVFRRQLWLQT